MVTYFDRKLQNAIAYDFALGYINRDKQHDYGVEAEIAYQPSTAWNIKLSYAFTDGETTQKLAGGKDTSFYNLIRRPKHAATLFAGYQLTKNLFVSTTLQAFDKRQDTYFNSNTFTSSPVVLKAYGVWNLYAEYGFDKAGVKLFADAKNLTNNKDYQEVYGYSVQGFTINGGIRFQL